MNPLLAALPIFAVAFAIVYGISHALGRLWVEHKMRLALLEKLQDRPDLIESFQELRTLILSENTKNGGTELLALAGKSGPASQSYPLTGIFLALIGGGCLFTGRAIRMGQFAAGIYTGGIICVAIGILLTVAGLLIQRLARRPVLPPFKH